MMKKNRAAYFLILFAFLADRLSKWWVAAYFAGHGPVRLNDYFTLQQTFNEGVAFGMFQGVGKWVGWLTLFVVVGLLLYLQSVPKQAWLVWIGLGVLIGGASGNMVDRIMVGRVLDFIVSPLRSGVFNVADVAINTGMVLIIVGSLIHRKVLREDEETAVSID